MSAEAPRTITAEQNARLLELIGAYGNAEYEYGKAMERGAGCVAAGAVQRAARERLTEFVISHLGYGLPLRTEGPR